jgi:hypothetical protein
MHGLPALVLSARLACQAETFDRPGNDILDIIVVLKTTVNGAPFVCYGIAYLVQHPIQMECQL